MHTGRRDGKPEMGLCMGKDCRDRCEFSLLLSQLGPHCNVVKLPCIDICKGPVAVLDPRGENPRIYRRLRKPKSRRDLLRLARDNGEESEHLTERRVRGSKKKGVLKRLRRALAG